jgi:NADH-quinone oxidoreductase subunit F
LEIFQELQAQQGVLTQDAIDSVAQALKIPTSSAFGVASFYSMLSLSPQKPNVLRFCDGPVCWLHSAEEVRHAVENALSDNAEWTLERTSCLGLCDRAPAALVNDQQAGPVLLDRIAELTNDWRGEPVDHSLARRGEKRVMLAQAGIVDPDSLESALEHGAYRALDKALGQGPEEILVEVEGSGLAGRGGAGFPVGRKWRFVAQAEGDQKYVICNADESEPLIFKDRVLIDTNPHQILEGMAVAGFATGAQEAYIYIRGEYESQAARLERAIKQAETAGWLGEHIQGSDFSFHIHVHRGAGAYICGEETALIESLEGKRGEPRVRPPYPPTYGFRGMPSLACHPWSITSNPSPLYPPSLSMAEPGTGP